MFALGGERDAWREVPLYRIAWHLEDIRMLFAERDVVAVDVAAFPHWGGPKSDPHRGDRAREEFRAGLVSVATGGANGRDDKGRVTIQEQMFERITGWLDEAGIVAAG